MQPGFTNRFTWNLEKNAFTRAVEARRASGLPVLNLSESNPTNVGFSWDAETLADALSAPENAQYNPDPRGLPTAREAVAAYYRERGANVSPAQIHLTASTSEAYGWLLKLLTNPGDAVLTPTPSYPLLQFLAGMECVETHAYPIFYDNGRWRIDADALEKAVTPKTRAVFCVSPNNPTGSILDDAGFAALRDVARRHGLALIVDEVFSDYGANGVLPLTRAGETETPVFVLNGFSKIAALPQAKLGWIVTAGDAAWREAALARLDFIADTYLSVNAPAQHAAAKIFAAAPTLRDAIRRRCDANEMLLESFCRRSAHGLELLRREAGWTAVAALPRGVNEDALTLDLARNAGVILHPGYFYDMPADGAPHLIFSLITPPDIFAEALPAIDAALLKH